MDIVKAAVEKAPLLIAQVNASMPRVHGDGFLHIDDVDFIVPHDEPLLEYETSPHEEIAARLGKHAARLVQDGDTIQVGYGSIPSAILASLSDKKHLGIHTELLSDGLVDLLRRGAVDNSRKTLNRGKTVATFCMGHRATYDFIHDNPAVELRTADYTNNPLVIAQHQNMVAINTALEIDLTGQATAESLGRVFYSGVGGQADFMRGTVLAPGGRTILAVESTAQNGTVSRIVPFLREGAGVTLSRADVHYVITEYGTAYLHGKNIRQRAMELAAIAHPKFRAGLIAEARRLNLVYPDQAFIQGRGGEYPEYLETYRTTRTGLEVFLRPIKISDEPLLKDFVYSLSDQSLYRRFVSARREMPHEFLQRFVIIDYTREMGILAVLGRPEKEAIIGVGRYYVDEASNLAEVALTVRDDYQNLGVGTELLRYLAYLARQRGLAGFTAEVLAENQPMLHLFAKMGFATEEHLEAGTYELTMRFGTE